MIGHRLVALSRGVAPVVIGRHHLGVSHANRRFRGTELLGTPLSDNTGDRAPPFRIDGLQHFSAMNDLQGRNQAGEFSRVQQMLVGLGPPTEVALRHQKRLDHQRALGRNRVDYPLPASAVEIIEYHHHVEGAEIGPVALQVDGLPIDRQPALFRRGSSRLEPGGVAIDGDDIGPAFGGGETVASFAAPDVEDSGFLPDQEIVPGEPGAGWGDGRRRRRDGH